MFFPPLVERELRVALRKRGAVKSRFQVAVSGVVLVSVFMLWGFVDRSWGTSLHKYLFFGGLYLAIIPSLRATAGLFSEERRNKTLELLFLTGMNSGELFLGKLFGGIMIASCDLLALAPLLAVPFLGGGISLDLYLATIACFPALLLFTVAVGALASALCAEEGTALVCAAVLLGTFSLLVPIPYSLGGVLAGAPPFSSAWLCLSPGFGPYLVGTHFVGFSPQLFWMETLATLTWTGLLLCSAALVLKRNWQQDIQAATASGWRKALQSWIHGTDDWRTHLRNRLLEKSPFQWLSQQDRGPMLLAWGLIGGVCLLWMLGWCAWPRYWPCTPNFFLTAMLLIMAMDFLVRYSAARRIGIDRHDGALELLLTTPLTPAQIVDGQLAALRAQFRPVRLTILGLCILMMLGGLFTRHWNTPAVVTYLLIWLMFFLWCMRGSSDRAAAKVMWVALNTGRPVYSVFRSQGRSGQWFWILFNLRNLFSNFGTGVGQFPTGSIGELIIVCVISGMVMIVLLISAFVQQEGFLYEMRDRLVTDMYSVAQEPVPDKNNPRLKKWDVRERLNPPPPGYGIPQLPHPFPKNRRLK